MIGFGQPATCYSCAAKPSTILSLFIGVYRFPQCVHRPGRQFEMRRSMISAFVSLANVICLILMSLYEFHVSYVSENGFWHIDNVFSVGMLFFGLSYADFILITFTKVNMYTSFLNYFQAAIMATSRAGNDEFSKRIPKYRLRWLFYAIVSVLSCGLGIYHYWFTNVPIHLCTSLKLFALNAITLNTLIVVEAITDLNGICCAMIRETLESEIRHTFNANRPTLQQSFNLIFMCYRSIDLLVNLVNPGLTLNVVIFTALVSTLMYVFVLTVLTLTATPFTIYYCLLFIYVESNACYVCYTAGKYKIMVCNNYLRLSFFL